MQNKKRILVIGEVYTDNHIDQNIVRLGGIFHSARMLSAIKGDFGLAAILPSYLLKDFEHFSDKLNASSKKVIGEIKYSPNIININESKEIGSQGYQDILRDQAEIKLNLEKLNDQILEFKPTDIVIYPGKYDLQSILKLLMQQKEKLKIHIDFQYSSSLSNLLNSIEQKIETIILSTSSNLFEEVGSNLLNLITSRISDIANFILLKENRGGSTLIDTSTQEIFEAPAYLAINEHSVGIGDCYNVAYISLNDKYSHVEALKLASYYSSEYAVTYDYELFERNIGLTSKTEIISLKGVRLPWDIRKEKHIYIAGPDFPNNDRRYFEEIELALKYHNFVPHRPIIENGLYTGQEEYHVQQQIYNKDLELLEKSELMIAVLLENDPGTLVEIGWMNKKGKPIILFDPFNIAHNLFLKKSVTCIVKTMDEVIYQVFKLLNTDNGRTSNYYDSLLLMSGGLDSTTLAYDLISKGKKVLPIFIDYGQHFKDRELSSLIEVIPKKLKAHLRIINISDIYKFSTSNMILEANLWINEISADDLYLPYRNLLFLAIASSIAQSEKIDEVYSAFINSNHAKEIDCSTEFFDKLEGVLSEYGSVKIVLPYRELEKYDVILKGKELNVPMAITYSCQTNSKVPCGVCPNCIDREEAISNFSKVQVKH
ncbi:7-cyano-7-deazaguanine synthase [Lysinibacillus sp. NPDC097231]|uniref:7-cyano-7-deazaguanine synthase n=1 Tax=Lysinibacillus sp. NPDC097231 TaxID=3364142 RepID=UPI003806DCCE